MFRRLLLIAAVATFVPTLVVRPVFAADDKKPEKKTPPSLVVLDLKGALTETPTADDLSFSGVTPTSLRDLVAKMNKAAKDPGVKGVVLLLDGAEIGTAQKEELRQALARVRAAGKNIHAHADSLQFGEYALLCGANKLSVVPTGDLWLIGMHGEAVFIRGLLDKLGVQPDFLTCGAFKSAAEMFMRKSPSPEAEAMQNWLFDGIFETYVGLIAKGRGVDNAKAKAWIDGGPYTAERAKAAGLIDAVQQRQDFEAGLKAEYGMDIVFDKKYGEKPQPKLDFSNPFAIFKILGDAMNETKTKKSTKPAIGIVYVDGGISLGSAPPSLFGSESGAYSSAVRKALDEANRDDSIKAVVLRVDSPGGSAVASEIILDATRRVKAKKPFVVSMGNVAGSGGYYVACASDVIFADEATITGSIGVVSGKFNTTPMWDKVGITFKPFQRGKNAGMLASDHTFTPAEREIMQKYMDEIYEVFKGHVTAIRGSKLKKPIDELAGGRVYTGKQALELGLVDRIGTLDDAIKYVAEKISLSEYEIRSVPEPKGFLDALMEASGGGKEDKHTLDAAIRFAAPKAGLSLLDLAAPELKHLDPARVRMVTKMLRQLQTMQKEGVMLIMPEFRIP